MAIEVLCLPFNNAHLWCHDLPLCDICLNDKLGCYHKQHFISFNSSNYDFIDHKWGFTWLCAILSTIPLPHTHQWCLETFLYDICLNDMFSYIHRNWFISIFESNNFISLTINGELGLVSFFSQHPPWCCHFLPHDIEMNNDFSFNYNRQFTSINVNKGFI